MQVEVIPCFEDNYSYIVRCPDTGSAAIVDPSDAEPLLLRARERGIVPTAIWCTHHHHDHVAGLEEVAEALGITDIVAHEAERARLPGATRFVADEARWQLGTIAVRAIHTPGHTRGALCFHCEQQKQRAVFTGDTLFVAGCGRLFEGTAEELFASLAKLSALPGDTLVYCGHEYTAANLRFARQAEPANRAVVEHESRAQAARALGRPTVPSTMADERAVNPFLRASSVAELALRRRAKDRF